MNELAVVRPAAQVAFVNHQLREEMKKMLVMRVPDRRAPPCARIVFLQIKATHFLVHWQKIQGSADGPAPPPIANALARNAFSI